MNKDFETLIKDLLVIVILIAIIGFVVSLLRNQSDLLPYDDSIGIGDGGSGNGGTGGNGDSGNGGNGNGDVPGETPPEDPPEDPEDPEDPPLHPDEPYLQGRHGHGPRLRRVLPEVGRPDAGALWRCTGSS